jgi:hypothetical protein
MCFQAGFYAGVVVTAGSFGCGLPYTVSMIAPLRFLWNATRGHRLQPWKSEYIKWRMETYSGMKADQITGGDMFRFVWREKSQLLRFLRWTGEVERYSAAGRDS